MAKHSESIELRAESIQTLTAALEGSVVIDSFEDDLDHVLGRMDDKLSRMIRGKSAGEDATLDYVGYYFMLKIAELREGTA